MSRILHIEGTAAAAEVPDPTDAERAQRAAAKRAADREEAAHRIQQYCIARVVNPGAARRMPDLADLQMLLDERKMLYGALAAGQAQQVNTLVLVLHTAGIDSVAIHPDAIEQVQGWAIQHEIHPETNIMTLRLVRPAAEGENVSPAEVASA